MEFTCKKDTNPPSLICFFTQSFTYIIMDQCIFIFYVMLFFKILLNCSSFGQWEHFHVSYSISLKWFFSFLPFYFVIPQNAPGSFCVIPATLSPWTSHFPQEPLIFSIRAWCLETKTWVMGIICCHWMSLLLVLLAHSEMIYSCMCSIAKLCLLFVTPWTLRLCPWDFLGKNTGVGCHFLLYIPVE